MIIIVAAPFPDQGAETLRCASGAQGGAGTALTNSVRALIEKVVVHGGDSRGGKVRRLELHGDLFRMLEFAHASTTSGRPAKRRSSGISGDFGVIGTPLVAGAGFEPATFRL